MKKAGILRQEASTREFAASCNVFVIHMRNYHQFPVVNISTPTDETHTADAEVQTDLSVQSISELELGFSLLTSEKYRLAKDKDFTDHSLQSDDSKVNFFYRSNFSPV